MSKVIFCLTSCILMALVGLNAGAGHMTGPVQAVSDTAGLAPADTTGRVVVIHRRKRLSGRAVQANDAPALLTDSASSPSKDSAVSAVKDSTGAGIKDSTGAVAGVKDSSSPVVKDTAALPAQDGSPTVTTNVYINDTTQHATKSDSSINAAGSGTAESKPDSSQSEASSSASLDGSRQEADTRWFISPLLKGQFQDFGMLEKNRKGYLSDANSLPFQKRGNASIAASAYKNITGRLSFSADLGLSFGHVTNDSINISQTQSKTYNLLNATVYYHLLASSYRLQPYVFVGINDLINDKSYLTAPAGIGVKFTTRKVMALAQLAYGYAVNKNTANTTMYSVGIYLPLKNKKQKKQEEEDKEAKKKDDQKKKDSTNTKGGNITNNIYITINMDSILKAKGLLNDDGSPANSRKNGGGNDDGDDDGSGGSGGRGKRKRGLRDDLKLDGSDLAAEDFKMDTIDGVPVIRFVVYFEFNDYSLTSKAFNSIDRVIGHLRLKDNLSVLIKGYTDNVGDEHYNNQLSRRRAGMVKDYLNSRGVPSELIKAQAFGSDNPVADNSDPNQAWLNRRAEIIVREK